MFSKYHLFEGTDCCVTPVLDLDEAREHPHAVSKGSFHNNFPRSNNMIADKNTIGSQQSIHSIFDKLSISKKFL